MTTVLDPPAHAPGTTAPEHTSAAVVTIRTRLVSGRIPLRSAFVLLIALVGLVLAVAWSVGAGDTPISLPNTLAVLAGGGDSGDRFVILDLRLPRAVVGLAAGAALAISGALFQTLARNPLASPDVLGITDGASVGAVLVVVLGSTAGTGVLAQVSALGTAGAALAGGLIASALLYTLAWRRGIDGTRLVLIGIGLSAVLGAFTSWLLVSASVWDAQAAYVWLSGSLASRDMHHAVPLLWVLAVLAPVAVLLSRTLRTMQLGDDTATGLGVRLQLAQLAVILTGVVLTAFAVAAAGPVEFVAFVTPQIALRLVGGSRPPVLTSAVLGAVLVVAADTFSRTLLPHELPVGLVTAIIGAPYLIWLLVRTNRKVSA